VTHAASVVMAIRTSENAELTPLFAHTVRKPQPGTPPSTTTNATSLASAGATVHAPGGF